MTRYYQPYGWNIASNTRTAKLSDINMDVTHVSGDYAEIKTEDSISEETMDDRSIRIARYIFISDNAEEQNRKLYEWNLITQPSNAPDVSQVIENTYTDYVDDLTKPIKGPTTVTGGTANDRIGTLVLNGFKVNNDNSNLHLVVALTQLSCLQADNSNLKSVTIQKECKNLQSVSLKKNKELGVNSWAIGSFTYTPKWNDIKIDYFINESDDVKDEEGYVYGHQLSSNKTFDWQTWIQGGKLSTLDMNGCNIKVWDQASWKKGGGTTIYYKIRFGSNLNYGQYLGVYKKFKADGFNSWDSTGNFTFGGKKLIEFHIETYKSEMICVDSNDAQGTKTVYGESGHGNKANEKWTGVLSNKLIDVAVYDQGTNTFSHDFVFVIWPFGQDNIGHHK